MNNFCKKKQWSLFKFSRIDLQKIIIRRRIYLTKEVDFVTKRVRIAVRKIAAENIPRKVGLDKEILIA
jgi:hypothetical protein